MTRKLRALSADDLVELPFDCGGCRYWESVDPVPATCGSVRDASEQRDWFEMVVSEWGECGRTAVEDAERLGFIKYAPSRYFPQVWTLRAKPQDAATPLIACMHISPDARHHGLGTLLLRAALKDLLVRGERKVEAYADARPQQSREDSPFMPVEFLERNGFVVVVADAEHPLMQLELKSLATWSDNLDTVLQSLKFPLRIPTRQPAPW